MTQRDPKKRGFTLTELTVVLAVMAIVATLAVTFSSLISKRRAESHARLAAMQDISVAESMIEGWIKSNEPTVTERELTVESNPERSVRAENGTLYINGEAAFAFDRVTDITFSTQTNGVGHTIYFCSVAYTLPEADEEENYTFCVYKEGEAIEGGGA